MDNSKFTLGKFPFPVFFFATVHKCKIFISSTSGYEIAGNFLSQIRVYSYVPVCFASLTRENCFKKQIRVV
jgi:hypothetical protein